MFLYPRAVFHLKDGVCLFGDGGVVSDYNDGAAVIVGEGAEDLYYICRVGRVEVACRLVGEDDLAALREGARDRNSLLLTARKMGGETVVVACGKLNSLADLYSQFRGIFPRHLLQIERVADILLHGQKWKEVVILINYADGIAAEAVSVPLLRGLTVDYDLALGRNVESRHKRKERGLARARLADDGIALSGLEIIRYSVHCANGLVFSSVTVRYVFK